MKKILTGLLSFALVFGVASVVKADKPSDVGFSDNGYNEQANLFNGTGAQWCVAGGQTVDCLGVYSNDNLVMKWNDEWDRGNAEGWTDPNGYKAWTSNEWNGNTELGSGEVWHYKIIWVGSDLENSPYWRDGGYAIWGQFEVIMDQGTYPGTDNIEHLWGAHGLPTGYGGY